MFRKKNDDELWRLQRELLAAEEEEYGEEYEEEDTEDPELEDLLEDYEDAFESDYEEEYEDPSYSNYANRYRRGSLKRFEDKDFFDEEDFQEGEVVYKKDYKKAKRKKRRQNFGLLILAILELVCIAAIIVWWIQWTS